MTKIDRGGRGDDVKCENCIILFPIYIKLMFTLFQNIEAHIQNISKYFQVYGG